jgi:hypothetical protein
MALLHQADLRPTKLELLAAWMPSRPWYRGPVVPDLRREAAFRFDDPDGEVGIETLLVRAGDGPLLQTPLTYRPAPLDGHERWLVGTMEHSVLGRRWVYDACGDPVYARVLANTILTGAGQAEEILEVDGQLERREPNASVRGSGAQGADVPTTNAIVRVDDDDPTLILTDSVELTLPRVLDGTSGSSSMPDTAGQLTLAGTWNGQSTPLLLAHVRAF